MMGSIGNLVHKATRAAMDISSSPTHPSKLSAWHGSAGADVTSGLFAQIVSLHLDDLSSRGDSQRNATGTDCASQQFRSVCTLLDDDPMKVTGEESAAKVIILMPAALSMYAHI
jgi:hypothetical protein